MIKPADKNDIDSIVELFTKYIDNSFFVELGDTFLRIFLKALIKSEYALNFVYIVDSKVIGFISSTYDYSKLFKEVFIKKGVILLKAVLHTLLKNPCIIKNLWESLFYACKIKRDSLKAELLFIAIEYEYRKGGVATRLISRALIKLKEKNIKKVKVFTDQFNQGANRLLQKLNFQFIGFSRLYGKKICLYNKEI